MTCRSVNLVPSTSVGETENINFIECCVTWVKNSIYSVTNTGVEFLMHNHPFFTHLLRGVEKGCIGNKWVKALNFQNHYFDN